MRAIVSRIWVVPFVLVMVLFSQVYGGSVPAPSGCSSAGKATSSSIKSNFNGTSIAASQYIWFNSHISTGGVKDGTQIWIRNSSIQFSVDGKPYMLEVPNAVITFQASAKCAKTTFEAATQTWKTTVPLGGSDEIFLTGLAFQVPSKGLPGGINPVTWNGIFQASATGISIKWKWGAAVYKAFSTDYNKLAVKATHKDACDYNNSDHAGTPEAYKGSVVGGARGGGGSNFTGSWSGTQEVELTFGCTPPAPKLTLKKAASNLSVALGGMINYVITLKNTGDRAVSTPVTVTDALPAGIELQNIVSVVGSAGSNYSYTWPPPGSNTVTFTILKLEIGETVTIKFKVKVKEDAPACAKIVNTAEAGYSPDSKVLSNPASLMTSCQQYQCSDKPVDLGMDPVGVAINPATHEAVITTGAGNQVIFVDLLAKPPSVIGTLTVDNPHGVAVNPQTNQAVVTNTTLNKVTLIDLATHKEMGQVIEGVGLSPRGVAINPKTNTAVVANYGWDSVTIIDLAKGIYTAILPVGKGPDTVAIDPDRNLAAIVDTLGNTVSVIDLASSTVQYLADFNLPAGAAFNPVSGLLYVVNQGSAQLSQLQVPVPLNGPPVLMGNITVAGPGSVLDQVAVHSKYNQAVVGDFSGNALIFIDLATGASLGAADLTPCGGIGPRGLAIDEELGIAIVVHQNSNVAVIVRM